MDILSYIHITYYAVLQLLFFKGTMEWMILLLKIIMFSILNYNHISFTFVILFVLYILYIITQDLIEKPPCWICYPV